MLQQSLQKSFTSIVLILVLTASLAACSSPKQSIIGKWEQTSGSGIGSIYEFFKDGTVSMGTFAGNYTWPDSSHLKIEYSAGAGFIYETTLTGDELILKDASQTTMVFKRYMEFTPSPQLVAGSWKLSYPDESECLKALGLEYTPSQIVLDSNGAIKIEEASSIFIADSAFSMSGQFSFNADQIHILASGTKTFSSLFGETETQPISGEVSCGVTLSNTRLIFTDSQGRTTLFIKE